jgi:hypothetical protein
MGIFITQEWLLEQLKLRHRGKKDINIATFSAVADFWELNLKYTMR